MPLETSHTYAVSLKSGRCAHGRERKMKRAMDRAKRRLKAHKSILTCNPHHDIPLMHAKNCNHDAGTSIPQISGHCRCDWPLPLCG
jgi:hypothetical protein